MTNQPYPKELVETVTLADGETVCLRPIRPEDEAAHDEFFTHLTEEDIRFRFFSMMRTLSRDQVFRFVNIDYDREMAFIATTLPKVGPPLTLGVARAIAEADNSSAEFAVIVRSDLKLHGLGTLLMQKLIHYCHDRGIRELVGPVMRANEQMRHLCQGLGFETRPGASSDTVEMRLDLTR